MRKFIQAILIGAGLPALAGAAVIIVFVLATPTDAAKQPSDKQRIEALEKQVAALNEVLADYGAWKPDVEEDIGVLNQRTLDLHKRLGELESRGPVASAVKR